MLKQYLLENFEDLVRVVNDINKYNGKLSHLIVEDQTEELLHSNIDEIVEELQNYINCKFYIDKYKL